MEIRKCDRCGQTRATNAPRNIEIIKKYNYDEKPQRVINLCNDCYNALVDWLEEKGVKFG